MHENSKICKINAFSHRVAKNGGIMDLNLKNKVALVTGSTEGIGLAIARDLAKEGATVYINGRTKEKVERVTDQLKKEKLNVKDAPFDLSTPLGIEALTKKIPSVDILINNLGIYEVKPFAEITDEDWDHILQVNVMSGVRLCRFYFPKMLKKNWGRIIFISSESGVNTPSEMIHYGTTKSAQLAISRGLAELTKGTKVTVNSVLPGPTLSPGVKQFLTEFAKEKKMTTKTAEKQFFETGRPSSLLGRFAEAEEVSPLVAFLCSDKAAAINGSALRVEGGVIRSII